MKPDFLPLVPGLVALVFLTGLSALLTTSETALIALSRLKLRHLVAQGSWRARIVQRLVNRLDRLIAVTLVGNNFVQGAIGVLGTLIAVEVWGEHAGPTIAVIGVSLLILIGAELTPKILATQRTEFIALSAAPFLDVLVRLLDPFARVFTGIGNLLLRLTGARPTKRSPLITEEEIRMMIEVGKEEGVLGDEERKILHRIFEFGDARVGDVMTPMNKMVSIAVDASADELLNVITEERLSRIPVTQDRPDNVIGVIFAKDLLSLFRNRDLIIVRDIVHPAPYVAKDKRVTELLRDFQRLRVHMAIVVDAQKRALGLVTFEDLIEEIVGEVADEYES